MAVRTKQLVVGRFGVASTTTNLYTAPSGETVILKSIAVSNRSTGSRVFSLGLTPVGKPATFWHRETIPAGETRYHDRWVVMLPGDLLTLQGFAGEGTDSFFIWISGAELEGLAD